MVGFHSIASLFLALPLVASHGIVSSPKAEFDPSKMRTSYVATIPANFPGKFDDSPAANVAAFNKAFKEQSKFKTLREMLDPHGPDCGYTLTNGAKQPIPSDNKMTWKNPDTGEGFIPSHTGPCEVWINDKRVFQDDNCASNFPDKPEAHLPVDYSSCTGDDCMLRFYWIALHEPQWQVYKNCVPLQGNGKPPAPGPAPTTSGPQPNPTPAPQPTSGPAPQPTSGPGPQPSPSYSPAPGPSPLPHGGKCANVEADIDYYGNDIKHISVSGSAQKQVNKCCKACTKTKHCVGFTINHGTCWLKNKLENPGPRPGAFSASHKKANKLRWL